MRAATQPIGDDSTGRLMEGILASFAQFDNDVRSERTTAGMKAALLEGRWTFPAPLGYRRAFDAYGKGIIEPDPVAAPLVESAFKLIANGESSKAGGLRRVTALGLRTKTGKKIRAQTFEKMLRNPLYAGWISVPK